MSIRFTTWWKALFRASFSWRNATSSYHSLIYTFVQRRLYDSGVSVVVVDWARLFVVLSGLRNPAHPAIWLVNVGPHEIKFLSDKCLSTSSGQLDCFNMSRVWLQQTSSRVTFHLFLKTHELSSDVKIYTRFVYLFHALIFVFDMIVGFIHEISLILWLKGMLTFQNWDIFIRFIQFSALSTFSKFNVDFTRNSCVIPLSQSFLPAVRYGMFIMDFK